MSIKNRYLSKDETKEIVVESPHKGYTEYRWSRIRYPADLSVEHALQAGILLGYEFITNYIGDGLPYLALLDVEYKFLKNYKPKAKDVCLYDSENLQGYPSNLVSRQKNIRSVSIAMSVSNYSCFSALRKALNTRAEMDQPDENVWAISAFAEFKFQLKDVLVQRLEKPIEQLRKIEEDKVEHEIPSQIIIDISFGAGQLEETPLAIIIEASFRTNSLFEGQRITDEKIQELLVKNLAEYPLSKKSLSETPVTLYSILGKENIYIKVDGVGFFYRESIENWVKSCKDKFEFIHTNHTDDFEDKNVELAAIDCLESVEFYLAIYGEALGSALKQDLQNLWSSLPIVPHKLRQAALAGTYHFMWRLDLEMNDCFEKIKIGVTQETILVRANFNDFKYKVAQITYPSNLSVEAALQAGIMLGAEEFYYEFMDQKSCTNHLAILGVSWSFYDESESEKSEKNPIVELYFSQDHSPLIAAKMYGDVMDTSVVHYSATFGAEFVVAEQLQELLKAQQVAPGGLDWEDIGEEIRRQIFGSNRDKVKLSLPEDLGYIVDDFISSPIIIDVCDYKIMPASRRVKNTRDFDFYITITITDSSGDTAKSSIDNIFEAVLKHPALQVLAKFTRVDKEGSLVPISGLSPILIDRIDMLCDLADPIFHDDIDFILYILSDIEYSIARYGAFISSDLRKQLVSAGAELRRAIPREKRMEHILEFYSKAPNVTS